MNHRILSRFSDHVEDDLPNQKLASHSEPSEEDEIAELSQSPRKELIPQRSGAI